MALTITRNEKIFEIKGQINASTASYFQTHFVLTLNSTNGLAIDINKVTEIDSNGIQALKSIYDKAQTWKKPFYIIGTGSKELYKEFRNVA